MRNSKTKGKIQPYGRLMDKWLFWILLFIIAAVNISLSAAFMPMLVALDSEQVYSIIVICGLIFGFVLELLIRSMEHLEKRHHIFLAILIPVIALINVFIITKISNNLIKALNLKNAQNSIIVAVIYAASFVLPYLVYRFILKIEYYAKE